MSQKSTKILFLLKYREASGGPTCGPYSQPLHSGLFNSASFVVEKLKQDKFDVVLDHTIDGNCVDRLVTLHKPDVVVLEAYWVTPAKFVELKKLHPKINWIVRSHSEIPFIACEGIAMNWTIQYLRLGIYVAFNSYRACEDVKALNTADKSWDNKYLLYLPNYYPINEFEKKKRKQSEDVHVSCFGAIRPLKNQLIQAVAAIKFADKLGKNLRFHINGTRIETKGETVIFNLIDLFKHLTKHKLVIHDWAPHPEFLALVGKMDIGLQCSYTESFCIVAADHVAKGVPIVTSNQVSWLGKLFYPDSSSSDSIVNNMLWAYHNPWHAWHNWCRLRDYSTEAACQWWSVLSKF